MSDSVRELNNTELSQIAGGFGVVFDSPVAEGPIAGGGGSAYIPIIGGGSPKTPIPVGGDWWVGKP